jgi:hypothetical protein
MAQPASPQRIIVTPATDPARLRRLGAHLAAQKAGFAGWRLLLNTADPGAVAGIERLAAEEPWAGWTSVVTAPTSPGGRVNHHAFFPACAEPGVVYARLDETIAWLDAAFVAELFAARERPGPFLVHANVIGNPSLTWLHERLGRVDSAEPEAVHAAAAAAAESADTRDWQFAEWRLGRGEPWPLLAFAWTGAEFHQFGGRVAMDEDDFLCRERPVRIGRRSSVAGRAVCIAAGDDTPPGVEAAYAVLARRALDAATAPAPPEPAPAAPAALEVTKEARKTLAAPVAPPFAPAAPVAPPVAPAAAPAQPAPDSPPAGGVAEAAAASVTPAAAAAVDPNQPPPAPKKPVRARRAGPRKGSVSVLEVS